MASKLLKVWIPILLVVGFIGCIIDHRNSVEANPAPAVVEEQGFSFKCSCTVFTTGQAQNYGAPSQIHEIFNICLPSGKGLVDYCAKFVALWVKAAAEQFAKKEVDSRAPSFCDSDIIVCGGRTCTKNWDGAIDSVICSVQGAAVQDNSCPKVCNLIPCQLGESCSENDIAGCGCTEVSGCGGPIGALCFSKN